MAQALKIKALRAWLPIVERSTAEMLGRVHGARFDYRAGAYEMRLAGIAGTATMGREAAKKSWLRAARRRIALAEEACAGHVAAAGNPKVCQRCGVHIDDLRPDDDAGGQS
ncbi:hypothetical protein [Stappia sp. TSB10P1A]|uniref:hypothetical protein n=1 Tax=Stappia sp. TSB10P1A TaxID=2003585 RepID=UPI001643D413|nr:hypothetical protein [Stappia sp. TSB10P1A]